jgi:hypothetical protein
VLKDTIRAAAAPVGCMEGNPSQPEGIPRKSEGNPRKSEGNPNPAEGNPSLFSFTNPGLSMGYRRIPCSRVGEMRRNGNSSLRPIKTRSILARRRLEKRKPRLGRLDKNLLVFQKADGAKRKQGLLFLAGGERQIVASVPHSRDSCDGRVHHNIPTMNVTARGGQNVRGASDGRGQGPGNLSLPADLKTARRPRRFSRRVRRPREPDARP